MGHTLKANGTAVTIESGSGYSVGSVSSVTIDVSDGNDVPPTPSNLRINGHLDGGAVTLRWDSISDAGRFRVGYVPETCDPLCGPDGDWTYKIGMSTGDTAKEATVSGLAPGVLYRVQVQVIVEDVSAESNFALVYPTSQHPSVFGTTIATIPLHNFQKNGEFHYFVCIPTNPPATPESPAMLPDNIGRSDVTDTLAKWDTAVERYTGSANLVETSWTVASECEFSGDRLTRSQVVFYNDKGFEAACGENAWIACWVATGHGLDKHTRPGAIIFRQDIVVKFPGDGPWDATVPGNSDCTWLERTLLHEGGHAFGLHHGAMRQSIMSGMGPNSHNRPLSLCDVTKYDAAAIAANYQSR